MLVEKHLRAQSPQCFVFTRAQTKAETQLTAHTKAMETGSWSTGQLTTCSCYLLTQVPMTLWCPPLDQSLLLNK